MFYNTSESLYPLLLQYKEEIIQKWENGEYEVNSEYITAMYHFDREPLYVSGHTSVQHVYEKDRYYMHFDFKHPNYH